MLNSIFLAALGTPELIAIVLVVLLLFGGRKIPELMRGLGKGVKEFKDAKDGAPNTPEKEEQPK
jgi:sec-independent protein translocase protein TatA